MNDGVNERAFCLRSSMFACRQRCIFVRAGFALKSHVGFLQTAHSWANAGVLLGARVRRRVAFETIKYRDEVSERRKVIVN